MGWDSQAQRREHSEFLLTMHFGDLLSSENWIYVKRLFARRLLPLPASSDLDAQPVWHYSSGTVDAFWVMHYSN